MGTLNNKELVDLLLSTDKKEIHKLFDEADRVRAEYMGEGILVRGIIEFSNLCRNTCKYCGINKFNKKLKRYLLTKEEILESVKLLVQDNLKTVILQSGEDDGLDPVWLKDLIISIKQLFDVAITLSVGERNYEEYKMWKEAGADRFLLKIETTDGDLYEELHPGMSFDNRLKCLKELKELGYQVGSGNLVGLKGQSLESIANDIIFFADYDFDMIGIGPFIPHSQTELSLDAPGDYLLTLKTIALTRIMTKRAHIPATTALGSMEKDYRAEALKAGANVIMVNYTPTKYKELYEIYPGKRCLKEAPGACNNCLPFMAKELNRKIDYSKGNAVD